MEMILNRNPSSAQSTIGELLLNGAHECWTLEDVVRPDGVIIREQTAIRAGRYEVKNSWSPRFKRLMPEVLNVPGFEGIRIHWGNTAIDTAGCILTGSTKDSDFIGHSVDTFSALYNKIYACTVRQERMWLTINDASQAPSAFPITIRYTGAEEPVVVVAPQDIESGKTFKVLATQQSPQEPNG